jgi:geranylgeranyl pyrophosphate synthase
MSETFAGFVDRARSLVDEALERRLFPPAPGRSGIAETTNYPSVIGDAIRHSLFAGGKRLRPVLALAAADAVARRNGTPQETAFARAMPMACAMECLHTYSLIHDDLPAMDDDSLRRGRPTLHVVYGDGIAILAGDALQAEAFRIMAQPPPGPSDAEGLRLQLKAIEIVAGAAGVLGMVGGQAIDLQAAGQVKGRSLALDAKGLQGMHMYKTGAMIRASAVGGALMAGASQALERAIGAWGADVGLAFQIVDDVLDVEGTAVELGKTAGKDAANNKPTYPSLFGLERSKAMAAECRERAHEALAAAGLTDGWLDAIADWIISRKN